MRHGYFFTILLLLAWSARAQRHYNDASVLATGTWYKIQLSASGVYKVDAAFLQKLGINTSNLSSVSIRLFGNGGGMLPEACNGFKNDDLVENALQVNDGGDGIFSGSDFFLFFGHGPDTWLKDSLNHRFTHQKNLYSKQSYYYINIAGTGKRVQSQTSNLVPNTSVTSFTERYFHELDSVNFLSSSKDWYGEEFSTQPGHAAGQSFAIPLVNINIAEPATLISSCVARSIGGNSRFAVAANGQQVLQQDIAAVGSTNLDLFARTTRATASFTPANALSLNYQFSPGGINAEGWLDWFEIFCTRKLLYNAGDQLLFRDWNSVAPGNIAAFTIQNAINTQIWDITSANEPVKMITSPVANNLTFVNNSASLHEYIAFGSDFLVPTALGKIDNQDLHHASPADLLIITHPLFLAAAQNIALFHQQKDNLKTVVATTEQVYNEFSSGTPDPSAIRDFVKMYYDKAGGDSTKRPRYLLLLGDASYDYKDRVKNNSNYVLAYENSFSLDPLSTYTSDDFFGFLDDNEDINSGLVTNLLDIGIGRIPAQTAAQASAYVDKLVSYTDPKSLGPWRNQQTFIADDQDLNLHLNDAEAITTAAASTNPLFTQNKIYLDAFTQASTSAGSRYPTVNQAINDQVQNGTLIWNYNGHGSATRLAEEVVLEKEIVDGWSNANRLPLFITATCDFASYDNPAVASLGENILLREKTGGIALMTTTRLVFAFSNRIIIRNYLQIALQPRVDGSYLSLGDAVRLAKNFTYQTQADITNNRKFTLLGDPALKLAYPRLRVATVAINGKAISSIPDTLKALQPYSIQGQVRDAAGNPQTGFNGSLYATVFDKPQTISTKGNDADSYQQPFQVQKTQLYKGTVKVVNGDFTLNFIVPQDINYKSGNGSISYYADNGQLDANGNFSGFLVGGSAGTSKDHTGPVIKAYLNDESFISRGTVNSTPVLLLNLTDSSGINIAGTGIGHDITVTVDGDPKQSYVLNNFFQGGPDSYQKGAVLFQLPLLAEGEHTLVIKAWDVANNSSETSILCRVIKEGLTIFNVINYPNPFKEHTVFRFAHNRPNRSLQLAIKIFTVAGKWVKTINETINTNGSRSSDIDWNGSGENDKPLVSGVYFYRLVLTDMSNGESAAKSARLVRF